jgi:high affinity Mn2+ porin
MKTVISILILSIGLHLRAQEQSLPADNPPVTMFPHNGGRYWVSGQANFIFQAHVRFPAQYSGSNSFRNQEEQALSRLLTLYTGVQIVRGTEFLFDVESAGGRGLSDALGLAGFTNVDVVRNPDLGSTPYISHVMLHETIPLSKVWTEQEPGPLSIAKSVPVRRVEFRIGKFSTADFFDTNIVGGDSHLQFANWTTDNNGAYDYAADTRGYTYGVTIEYQQPRIGVLFGEMLMPKVANGIDLDWNLSVPTRRMSSFSFAHRCCAPKRQRFVPSPTGIPPTWVTTAKPLLLLKVVLTPNPTSKHTGTRARLNTALA